VRFKKLTSSGLALALLIAPLDPALIQGAEKMNIATSIYTREALGVAACEVRRPLLERVNVEQRQIAGHSFSERGSLRLTRRQMAGLGIAGVTRGGRSEENTRSDEVHRILEKLKIGGDLSWIGRESIGAEERLRSKPVAVNMDSRAPRLSATKALLSHFNTLSLRGIIDENGLQKLLVLYLRAMPEQVQLVDGNAAYENLRMFADAIMRLPIVASGRFVLANLRVVENTRGVETYQLRFGKKLNQQVRIEVIDNSLVLISDKWRARFPGQIYDPYYPVLKTVLAEIKLYRIQRSRSDKDSGI
jgi:hypothetical protein